MIYPHTDLKFRITITASDFNQRSNPWTLRVIDRFNRERLNMERKDFMRDSLGRFYFDMKDVLTGEYRAITQIGIPDEDFNDGYQHRTDAQIFLHVNMCNCHHDCGCHCQTDGMEVLIERVYTINIDGGDYLADVNGTPILDSEGNKIYFINHIDEEDTDMPPVKLNMTGEEFKKLIEGDEPNSEVNTIPEVMRVMQGISDDTTVKQEIKDETGTTYDEGNEKLYINGAKPKEE